MRQQDMMGLAGLAVAGYFLFVKGKNAVIEPAVNLDPTAGVVPNAPSSGGAPPAPILAGPVATQNYYYPTSTGLPTGYNTAYIPSFPPPGTTQPTGNDTTAIVQPPTAPVNGSGNDSAPIGDGIGNVIERGKSVSLLFNTGGGTVYKSVIAPSSGLRVYLGNTPAYGEAGDYMGRYNLTFWLLGVPLGSPRPNGIGYYPPSGISWKATADKPVTSMQSGYTEQVAPGTDLLPAGIAKQTGNFGFGTVVYPTTITVTGYYAPSGQSASKTIVITGPGQSFPFG